MASKVVKDDRPLTHPSILGDETIRLTGKAGQACTTPLRRVVYEDENKDVFFFLTNNFRLEATTIAAIYRDRWKIESFFKILKQNLKNLLGHYAQRRVDPNLDGAIDHPASEVHAASLNVWLVALQSSSVAPSEPVYLPRSMGLDLHAFWRAAPTARRRPICHGVLVHPNLDSRIEKEAKMHSIRV